MTKTLCVLIINIFAFSACYNPQKVDLIITNANIVNVESGHISENHFIGITGGIISIVDTLSAINSYSASNIIDAKGKFVMPGLWDNHVHFRGGEELSEENKNLLPLFLAYGITSVRDAGGDITPHLRAWQADIKNRVLDGPTIFTSGPKLDGANPAWDGSISVLNDDDVQVALDSLQSIDVDYVKMYDGNLTKEAFYSIIKEAERRGLKTTGHMPLSANLMDAISFGLDGVEHLYYPLKETSELADEIAEENSGYSMITPLMEDYNVNYAQSSYEEISKKEFYVTPTLHVGKTLAEILITDHSKDFLLAFIAPEIIQTYERRINSAKRSGEAYTKQRAFWVKSFSNMVKPMYDSGINILAGSDSGPFNSYTYPGESIHEELRLLVESSGLTPQEALITSVINGPKFFDLENSYGSLETGKVADILILNGNPLDDITQTRQIYSVIQKGKSYSKMDLNDLMESIKN